MTRSANDLRADFSRLTTAIRTEERALHLVRTIGDFIEISRVKDAIELLRCERDEVLHEMRFIGAC